MRYKSKRGTVINIPDGLDPKRIKAIKADADAGYGTRAQKTADRLGKKTNLEAMPKVTETAPVTPGGPDYFDDKGKIKDPDTVVKNITPTPNMQDLISSIEKSRQARYDYTTRNFEAQKVAELEAAKQELANRGIPYDPAAATDPNSQNLYGRTIGGINRSWQDRYTQADQDAYANSLNEGTLAYNAAVGAAGQSNETFLSAVLGMSEQELQRYGISKDYQAKLKGIAASKASRGSTSGGDSGGGFEIVG